MESRQILERSNDRMAILDLESKLLQNRIIFITGEINEETVATYQAELMYLTSTIKNNEKEKYPIRLYINSPGGECYSLLGLYDVIQTYIKEGYIIKTKVIGLAASAAAWLLLSGSKGNRSASPNSKIMLHQPSSGTWGTTTDMAIHIEESQKVKKTLLGLIEKHCGHDLSKELERDKWMTPEEALEYGIIDQIN